MNRTVVVLALAAILMMSGCFKVNIREDIRANGVSELTMSMEALNVSEVGWDKKNPCDDFKPNESAKLFKQPKCSFDGKTETITGQFDRKKAGGLTITGTKYRFDLVKAIDAFNENKSKKTFTLPKTKNQTQIDQTKATGFEYNYIVKLPGSVTGMSGGVKQSDGSVKFDILELQESDRPYVESDSGLGGLLGGLTGEDKASSDKPQTKPAGKTTGATGSSAGGRSIPCIPALLGAVSVLGALAARAV